MAKVNVVIEGDEADRPAAEPVEKTAPVKVKATPLPAKQMIILALILTSEGICAAMLLPFVGLFVTHLMGYENNNQGGKLSGVLVGLFMGGQVASSKLWGYMGDVYGRRIPLLVGLFLGGWAMLFFGLSPNIYVCCVLRLIHGSLNGITLCAKAMIADLTDATNEAQGFAMVSVTWALGSLIGPTIGGLLYNPPGNPALDWMHLSPDNFLGRYPAFLPSLLMFLYAMIVTVIAFFALEETSPHCRPISSAKPIQALLRWVPFLRCGGDSAPDAQDVAVVAAEDEHGREHVAVAEAGRDSSTRTSEAGDNDSVSAGRVVTDNAPKLTRAATRSSFAAAQGKSNPALAVDATTGRMTAVAAPPPAADEPKLTYREVMSVVPIRNITIFYMILAASDMTYTEIFPLWVVAEKDVGGLVMYSNDIAIIMLVCSIPSIVANLGFSRMCGWLKQNFVLFWMISSVLCAIPTTIMPAAYNITGGAQFWYMLAIGIVRQIGLSWSYSLIHMLTAKAAPAGQVGSVYGVSQSFASLTRCLVPFVVAPLFAWSIDRPRSFPINYWMLFLVAGACAVLGFIASFYLRITRNENDDARDAESARLRLERHAAHKARKSLRKNRGSVQANAGAGPDAAGREGDPCTVQPHTESDWDNSEDDAIEGVGGAYFSLVASFCVNPIQDAAIPIDQLEQVNRDAREARAVHEQGSCDDATEDSVDSQTPTTTTPAPVGGEKNVRIKASTQELLASLRTQQVESRRYSAKADANRDSMDEALPDV